MFIYFGQRPHTAVYTDACVTAGGSYCEGDWLYYNWLKDYPEINDAHKCERVCCSGPVSAAMGSIVGQQASVGQIRQQYDCVMY